MDSPADSYARFVQAETTHAVQMGRIGEAVVCLAALLDAGSWAAKRSRPIAERDEIAGRILLVTAHLTSLATQMEETIADSDE